MSDNKSAWQEWKENLGDARPWHIATRENVDEETSASRYSICLSCPELINLTKTCKKCGCFMAVKTKIKGATCPIGKW